MISVVFVWLVLVVWEKEKKNYKDEHMEGCVQNMLLGGLFDPAILSS